MFGAFSQKLAQSGQTAGVIISVALMLFLGFAMTRITKALRLPDVTAYILTGIFIGPYCLNLIPASVIGGMDFISDIFRMWRWRSSRSASASSLSSPRSKKAASA